MKHCSFPPVHGGLWVMQFNRCLRRSFDEEADAVPCCTGRAVCATPALRAQAAAPPAPGDLSGNWQGTLKVGKGIRIIFNIYRRRNKDGWSAKMYSIDQTPQPIPGASVTGQDSAV